MTSIGPSHAEFVMRYYGIKETSHPVTYLVGMGDVSVEETVCKTVNNMVSGYVEWKYIWSGIKHRCMLLPFGFALMDLKPFLTSCFESLKKGFGYVAEDVLLDFCEWMYHLTEKITDLIQENKFYGCVELPAQGVISKHYMQLFQNFQKLAIKWLGTPLLIREAYSNIFLYSRKLHYTVKFNNEKECWYYFVMDMSHKVIASPAFHRVMMVDDITTSISTYL